MKTNAVGSRVALFVSAIALVVQISPARASGDDGAEGTNQRRRVEITFTKWTTTATPTGALMAGFTGGDVAGDFTGEILARQESGDHRVVRLEAVYEVHADDRSFVALIRGGIGETKDGETAAFSGAGLLDGVVLSGWRTGAQVHVAFQTMYHCSPVPITGKCFVGTITIEGPDHDDDDD